MFKWNTKIWWMENLNGHYITLKQIIKSLQANNFFPVSLFSIVISTVSGHRKSFVFSSFFFSRRFFFVFLFNNCFQIPSRIGGAFGLSTMNDNKHMGCRIKCTWPWYSSGVHMVFSSNLIFPHFVVKGNC